MVICVSVLLIYGGCLAFGLAFDFTDSFPPFPFPYGREKRTTSEFRAVLSDL
jgi:hypothetical protein